MNFSDFYNFVIMAQVKMMVKMDSVSKLYSQLL